MKIYYIGQDLVAKEVASLSSLYNYYPVMTELANSLFGETWCWRGGKYDLFQYVANTITGDALTIQP